MIPVCPWLAEVFILVESRVLEIEGQRFGQLNLKLQQRRFSVRLWIQFVETVERRRVFLLAHVIGERRDVQIIPCGIALQNEHALDPENLRLGGEG
jgi:hypothetical protein